MPEGWGLTIFRRSIHLCPVVADCDTMFKKHTPNLTVKRFIYSVSICHCGPPQYLISKINNQEQKYVTFIQYTLISNKDKMAVAWLARRSRKVFGYPWPSQSSDLQQEDHDIGYTLHECVTLLLPDFYSRVHEIPNLIFVKLFPPHISQPRLGRRNQTYSCCEKILNALGLHHTPTPPNSFALKHSAIILPFNNVLRLDTGTF